ncbi:MCE family protein [Mycobacterium terramassiliense]|uniref:ABC-type transporter Mla maintaining outer membrane lipid asymmetry, periplasmic component MlaD n=1 Tax=Mycobacterium terramassiliense TaxID=1841859 RepID=A0A2U3NGE9_9MYCO|nr:MlaD family protein [Mycobacterium terramassiliense]SPM30598.1 ABC-type transporter Mla maintaining outer membrane lipid asymmetry, periplasmic component MlaD [Mycobacterium terramassiliense]
MLTRFVRIQLIIFATASIVGMSVLFTKYLQVPTFLGIGRITVTLELRAAGGLYRFANVTYRGVTVGTVTAVTLKPGNRVEATLSLNSSPRIPSQLRADVRSISAVGEQYVDLNPGANRPPYLHDGSIIPLSATTIPQPIGPVLDRTSALLDSIPKDKLHDLIDESSRGLGGAGYDLGSLFDSGATLSRDLGSVADNTHTLIDDAGPLLDSQAATADQIRVWARSLAGITEQITTNDPQLRTILHKTPSFSRDVENLLEKLKPTLPVLLANLTTVGQVALTYNPGLEQMLVLLPGSIAGGQANLPKNNRTGMNPGSFTLQINDPPPCTVGFLPPSSWRTPADTTTIDTPDGLYCKLPQDSPVAVRGARNAPCMDKPGKRAPTVEICKSDQPYLPLVVRQHVTGPYPLDPNLISQGIPPDSRVNSDDHLYGPVDGTPGPPPKEPAGPAQPTTEPTTNPFPPSQQEGQPATAPSAFENGVPDHGAVAAVRYNPRTGSYLAPDRHLYRQADVAQGRTPTSWKDLMLPLS